MLSLPTIESLDSIDNKTLSDFKQYGFCYVKLPAERFNTLKGFAQQSRHFFHQDESSKMEHPFAEESGGYMANIDKEGAYVERYSYRDKALPHAIGDKAELDDLKQYLQIDIAEKLLRIIFEEAGYLQHLKAVLHNVHAPMSFVYYPAAEQRQISAGLAAHKDTGLLTLLFIDQQGLEIKLDGQWQFVMPKPGHIIINAGRSLELMSGGAYRAILHRVTDEGLENKERVSIPLFLGPNPDIPLINYETGETLFSDYLEMAKIQLDAFFPLAHNQQRG